LNAGSYQNTAFVDVNDEVRESNEDNNSATISYEVIAAVIEANSSTELSGATGEPVTPAPSVRVVAGERPIAGVLIRFFFLVGTSGGSLTGAEVTTGDDGVATVGSWTLPDAEGTYTLTAGAPETSLNLVTFTATAETGAEGSWTSTGSLPAPRRDHTATLLSTGEVLIVGGTASGALLYDPAAETFSAASSPVYSHGQGVRATELSDGSVLIIGGAAEIYDPTTGNFTGLEATTVVQREYHTATLLLDGRVLLAGGQHNVEGGPQTIADAELYDPVTAGFTATASLNQDRSTHAAVRLPDGRVLIVGGMRTTTPGSGNCLNTAEIFTPDGGPTESGPFTLLTATMAVARCDPQAVLLANGLVLVVGGGSQTAELFDPATETFTSTGSMASLHTSGAATLLADGRVLVAGGYTATGPVDTDAAEIHDPTSGLFTAAAHMVVARQQFTATLLSDGRVLVVGGYSSTVGADIASAELFSLSPPLP
jgi:hypothetical protein